MIYGEPPYFLEDDYDEWERDQEMIRDDEDRSS